MSYKMRALIVIDNMNTGGIATSLYNFLDFQSGTIECDLLVFDKTSLDKRLIPNNVKIINSPKILKVLGVSQAEIRTQSKVLALIRALMIIITRVFSGESARRLLMTFVKKIGEYDLAISYAHDNGWKSLSKGCNDYVANKVSAKTKVAYVHCDYSNFGGYNKNQEYTFAKFDYIALVSESCRQSFCKMFPNLKDKSIVLENYTNTSRIRELADMENIEYDKQIKNFVSVCRLSTVKGLDRVIRIFYELETEGLSDYKWVIVGDGPEYSKLNNDIKLYGLDDKIHLVGNKVNPYPFIKNASAFLLPSIHEAAPMVYAESATLGVPVITTKTCSAVELVQNRNMGIVIENDDFHIKEKIRAILCGKEELVEPSLSDSAINKNAKEQFFSFLKRIENDNF